MGALAARLRSPGFLAPPLLQVAKDNLGLGRQTSGQTFGVHPGDSAEEGLEMVQSGGAFGGSDSFGGPWGVICETWGVMWRGLADPGESHGSLGSLYGCGQSGGRCEFWGALTPLHFPPLPPPPDEEIEITFSYWDGSGHRRTVKVGF